MKWKIEQDTPDRMDYSVAARDGHRAMALKITGKEWPRPDEGLITITLVTEAHDAANGETYLAPLRDSLLFWKAIVVNDDEVGAEPDGVSTGEESDPEVVDESEDESDEAMHKSVVFSLDGLPRMVRKTARQHISASENLRFALVGRASQTLVALDDRLIVLKAGPLANAMFGCRSTTISYSDITGVQVTTDWTMAVVEITTPSYPVRHANIWMIRLSKKDRTRDDTPSPYVLPNFLPAFRRRINHWQPQLEELRGLISLAKPRGGASVATAPTEPAADVEPAIPTASLANEIKKLADLHEQGVLTGEEFSAAKARLLTDGYQPGGAA